MAHKASCGVVVTDGARLVLGHATGNRHWDIPKGMPEPGESEAEAAARELREETGIEASPGELAPLGRQPYTKEKDLVLFLLRRQPLPDPATLRCASLVETPGRAPFPELDRFTLAAWDAVPTLTVPRMARCLAAARAVVERA